MKRVAGAAAAVFALALGAGPVQADDARRSGATFMSPSLQAMQRDDSANPAMLWVKDGEALFSRPVGNGKSCASCHADGSLRGAAARYPLIDRSSGRLLNLAGRIAQCRTERQQAAPLPSESDEALGLAAYVALQSRGMPIAPPAEDPKLREWQARGQALYTQRMGQLNLSCAQCHDERAGLKLGGAPIPQAHTTGYPTYRLEWQALGSLQRRLRACVTGVRAQPFAADADEWLALEAYLARRAAGMAMDAPAVRP